jgi:predicted nucleic acid-binding Zn ribbon protein
LALKALETIPKLLKPLHASISKNINAMKTCLECGDKIIGREDKKFCSDGCRNTYNNKINKDSTNFMRNINNTLRKNYRILAELNAVGKSKTTRTKLLGKGFDFEFFTNILQTKTGNTYHFVYDQGYLLLDNDFFMLVKKDR